MNKPVKTKLCWNCEGNVSRFAENCPYCAVYLSPDSEDLKEAEPAPVKGKSSKEIPKAPYSPPQESLDEDVSSSVKEAAAPIPKTIFQTTFLPLCLLTAGIVSLFFAVILLLFSEHGKLTLQWDGELWYAYGIIALPLLFFGWKFLDQEQ